MMLVRRTALSLFTAIAALLIQSAVLSADPAAPGPEAAAPAAVAKTLSLDEAVALAIRHNPSVEIANQQIKANVGTVEQVASTAFPRVSATVTRTTPVTPPTLSFRSPGSSWETDFALNQTLFTWGAIGKGVKAAQQLLSSSRALYTRTQDQVAFATRQVYYGVLSAQDAVKVQYEILAAAQEQRRVAGLRNEAGVAPKYDVLSAEARVARVQQQVASAEGALNIAWANLSETLGVEVPTDTALTSTELRVAEEPSLADLVATAQASRPDVQAARALVTANEARLAVARTGNLPTISGTLTYSLVPKTIVQLDSQQIAVSQNSGSIALAASWNLYTGGLVHGEIISAEAQLEQSRQALRRLELGVESDVKNAYFSIQSNRAQVTAAQKEVEQAQEAKRIADIRYQEGVSTSVEVLDAQQTLGDAKNRLNAAVFNLNVGMAELDLAAGRPLAEPLAPGPRE